jgi:CRISPR/Cas system-associated exonuclease Cas4 (RecB family)
MEPIFDSERSTLDMSKAGIVNYVIRIANIQKTHPNFKFYVEKELAMSSDFKPVDYDQFNAQQDFSKRAIYRGKIDFVAFLPNVKLSVIDFKGGNYQAMMSDSLKQQLFTYMVMLFKMYPMFKNLKEYDMKLFLLTLNRIVPGGNFNSDYIDEVIVPEFITRVNTAAEVCKGNMFATNSKANCNYCNYKNACKNLTEVQTESGPKFLNLKEIVRDYGVVKIPNLTLSEIEGDIKKPRSCKVFLKYKDKLLSELA